jgi:hypothetical protein
MAEGALAQGAQAFGPFKIEEARGWKPRVPLERTLAGLLPYWREHVRKTPQ